MVISSMYVYRNVAVCGPRCSFFCVNGFQKGQWAAAVPKIQLTSVWPMLHAQTIKRALVRMGFIRMSIFAQPVSVN